MNNKAISEYFINDYELITINEKIDLILYKHSEQAVQQISFATNCGSSDEDIFGLANITMQLLTSSTQTRNAEMISQFSEEKGIKLSSIAMIDDSMMNVRTLSEFKDEAFEILTDCLCNPKFDEVELEKIKKKTLSRLEMKYSEPDFLSHKAFINNFYAGTSYGHESIGNSDSINSITSQDCINHYMKFIDGKFYIIVSGDYDKKWILEKINKIIKLNVLNQTPKNIFSTTPPIKTGIFIVDKVDSPQASIMLGIPSLDRKHKDYPGLQVVNTILGGYFGSRLNMILREAKGYTYGAHSYIDSRQRASALIISTDTNIEHTAEVLNIIFEEVEKLKTILIEEEELQTVKNYIYGSFLRTIDTPFQIAEILRNIYIKDLSLKYFDNYISEINAITPDKFREIANKHLIIDKYTIGISGDYKTLKNNLEGFYDSEKYIIKF